MNYEEYAKHLAKKYGVKTREGFEWLLSDLKEIYNHSFCEGLEVVVLNLLNGAYDDPDKKNYKSVFEYEMELRSGNFLP
jgi:hypothetical protein